MNRLKPVVIRLPNRQKSREEASLWIARLDRGLTDPERRELDDWLGADPQRVEALVALATLWDQTDVLAELADLLPLERHSSSPPRLARMTLAACVALAAVVAVGAVMFAGTLHEESPAPPLHARPSAAPPASADPSAAQPIAPQQIYETAVGEQSTVRLSDGSIVTLNTDSSIEVRYDESQRTVVLQRGEAYFEVAPDPNLPFRVRAGDRLMEAVGTAFNVRLGVSNDVTMMVTEGKVSVLPLALTVAPRELLANTPEAIVVAGNLAVMQEGPVLIHGLDPAEIDVKLSWQRGMLIFDGERLESALLEISRYTTVELVPDETIRDVRVGGYFRAGDIDAFLVALRDGLDIDSRRAADGRILLFPASRPR
jgi:transmembrane sensor